MYKYKKISLLVFTCFCVNISTVQASSIECKDRIGCEKRFCEIERQIKIAKEYGNERKLKGLNIALSESKSNCSDESIIKALNSKIDDIQDDILKYENDLKEAIEYKKENKILKYNNKIEEKKLKLKRLESELSTMQK